MWWFKEGIEVGGIDTRGIGKFEGTSTMRRACLLVVKSCKAEGKLLITSRTMLIKWNGHKEFPIQTMKTSYSVCQTEWTMN